MLVWKAASKDPDPYIMCYLSVPSNISNKSRKQIHLFILQADIQTLLRTHRTFRMHIVSQM